MTTEHALKAIAMCYIVAQELCIPREHAHVVADAVRKTSDAGIAQSFADLISLVSAESEHALFACRIPNCEAHG